MIQQEMLKYQSLDTELFKIERDLRKNQYYIKRKELKISLQKCEEQIARPNKNGGFEKSTVRCQSTLQK